MLIRATKTGTTTDGSSLITKRLVENSRHGQSVKPMTLPRTTTRCACSDNATLHVRTTATPNAFQTKIDQDMGLSPPPRNVRKVSGLTGN
ncbi:MAG: hypothetical protein OXC02_00185 [Rhodobacteraceae bacterium]|nr:hypothetical protein [Paracoccaceae bacterium]